MPLLLLLPFQLPRFSIAYRRFATPLFFIRFTPLLYAAADTPRRPRHVLPPATRCCLRQLFSPLLRRY